MLDERKASILRAVVEEYIQTAQPVGSGHVANAPGITVSSATVRNEMAALEGEGYLTQPHTSAGRIPTEKGYREFVDALSAPSLDRSAAHKVKSFFDQAHGEIEQMLADTTRLLAGLTDSAAVVVGPPREVARVKTVQLVSLTPSLVLFVAVMGNGSIEKRTIELGISVSEDGLHRGASLLSGALVGQPISALSLVGSAVHAEGSTEVDLVVSAVREAFRVAPLDDSDHVFVGGASQMVSAFDAVETVRSVLTILEQQLVVVTLLRDVMDRGLNVAIGSETGMQPLEQCALVVAPYTVDGEQVGTVGVLGPARMNYPQALAAVAVVGKRLGNRLSEG